MNTPFIKGLTHGVVTFVLFAVPFLLSQHGWTDITIGSVLVGIYQWALHYSSPTPTV